MRPFRSGYRSDFGDPDLDAERHRVALSGVGQRDLYGAGGWRQERGVDSIDVFGGGLGQPRAAMPRGYRRSDSRIYEDVCEAIAVDRTLDSRELEVSVVAGEVTLSGTVPARSMKLRAEAIADRVLGVIDIHNRLRVG
jgi:osmotically-inducible protein OsmY